MIKVKNLTKDFINYKKQTGLIGSIKSLFYSEKIIKRAVNNISFDIIEGEIVGYIGPNGAGKSTTIKMLTGILTPTSGEIYINNIIPYKDRIKNSKQIGVVFGQRTQLWWDLPVIESFNILRHIYDISKKDYNERYEFLDYTLKLSEFINYPVRSLSLGQRMRADLAASLLHNPKILFLDEPTIGLDIDVKDKIRNAIKFINERYKTTIILTTHDLGDIEELSSRIIVIDKGKVIYDGNINDLINKYNETKIIILELNNLDHCLKLIEKDIKKLSKDIHFLVNNSKLHIKFNKNEIKLYDIINYLTKSSIDIKDITIKETEIEDIVKKIYREGL